LPRVAQDFRDAVTSARSAFGGWSKQNAYLRGQILYRAAEMLEMREGELRDEVSLIAAGQRKPVPKSRRRSIVWCTTPGGRTSSARSSAP
jgi:acyl-CoA reductase-like NAD-dependent aldehyde dehydrogenase